MNRRRFLGAAALAAGSTSAHTQLLQTRLDLEPDLSGMKDLEILRAPDRVIAHFGFGKALALQYAAHEWTGADTRVTAEAVQRGQFRELPVSISSPGGSLTHIHLRWNARGGDAVQMLGDHWERSYGDLEWRGNVPERIMPWYFLLSDGRATHGCGVKTGAASLCFWMRDTQGVSLWVDLRNGGSPTLLGQRELTACTVVARTGHPGESVADATRAFCKNMCSLPKLPPGPIYGTNDWNYAYGSNSSEGTLRDADLVASLAPKGKNRPYIVIDDGWQDKTRFPDLIKLATQIRSRDQHPGIWVRPLRASETVSKTLLLPFARFGSDASHNSPAFDPTIAEALHGITQQVSGPVGWGYEFIKHDFSTYELFGRWGFEMNSQITNPGWHFQDRSKTNAEIILDLYVAIRKAAGETTVVLGCNTMGHLAAGIFESQRIADDTSGREWERTRRFGINGLAHRIGQHQTFTHVDPDCAAVTPSLDWKLARQWMDLVARSGTSLFLSPDPRAMNAETKSAMRDAMAIASEHTQGEALFPTLSTTPDRWKFTAPTPMEREYTWTDQDGTAPVLIT